jgi:hypothetical protein
MLYVTLLSPVFAFPALLFLEWLERWTMASISGRPSEPWLRPEKPQTPPRANTPRRARTASAVQRAPLHSGLGGG